MTPHPTDQRRHRRQTENRLLAGVLLILVLGGGSLISLIFGWQAGLSALLCLVPGAAIILLLWLLLSGVERLTRL